MYCGIIEIGPMMSEIELRESKNGVEVLPVMRSTPQTNDQAFRAMANVDFLYAAKAA